MGRFAVAALLVVLQASHSSARLSILRTLRGTTNVLKQRFPWYHSTEEIRQKALSIVKSCEGASFQTLDDSGVEVDAVSVKVNGTNPKNKVFLMFGEHSRELISPETGLRLLQVLCGQGSDEDVQLVQLATTALKDSQFMFVINANPRSRTKVEDGSYCLRANPAGVDLNRNWDEQWQSSSSEAQTNPGDRPFSEPESRIHRRFLEDFRPTTYLSVHSGTRGLYMPWAYDMKHLANRNCEAMMQILKDLDAKHCQCPFGAAGKEVGYSCPGTSVDWVYEKLNTSYAFAFEIYVSPSFDAELKDRWEKARGSSLLQSARTQLKSLEDHADLLLRERGAGSSEERDLQCFATFNPDTEEMYNSTVKNWVAAYLELAQQTAARMKEQA